MTTPRTTITHGQAVPTAATQRKVPTVQVASKYRTIAVLCLDTGETCIHRDRTPEEALVAEMYEQCNNGYLHLTVDPTRDRRWMDQVRVGPSGLTASLSGYGRTYSCVPQESDRYPDYLPVDTCQQLANALLLPAGQYVRIKGLPLWTGILSAVEREDGSGRSFNVTMWVKEKSEDFDKLENSVKRTFYVRFDS